ncbi:hypothetical protein [Clostridium folliculivorans]|uniref:hypothetical protein n=1 Tax=Clostridium folliculivorans TaxID=2886038 RepID=UPI0021C3F42B|nr:hypothetical protein [Clostridium folliculivorans]GKU30414.1 hypothetical protein CFB3_25210 [Clostridium folliculivorans]
MLNVYSKKFIYTIMASAMIVSLSTAVVYAAPNSNNSVTTGRTEQNVATGVIIANKVPTLAHGATDVTLTGTVVIDGPKLVLLVNGQDVSSQATLTKVADKTWTYQYKTTVGSQTGDVSFNIGAYTIYANGKPAGQVHTTASAVSQSVHVPFVKSYDYTNLDWTNYDRSTNEFAFSYNLVNVWDDGIREVANPITASISGTETYKNLGFEIQAPVVVKSFVVGSQDFSNYDRTNNTYDLNFNLTKNLSNGTSETTTVSKSAVDASNDYVYTSSSDGLFPYSQDFTFVTPVTVRDFTASEGTFTNYNPTDNTYTLTFDLTKVLSKGDAEIVPVSETVDAASAYTYTASDDRAPGYSEDFSFTPPVAFRDFTFSADAPVWTYNPATKTYSVSFVVNETYSNGNTATETITRDGLTPGASVEESVAISGVTHTQTLIVPASPAPAIPASVDGTVASGIKSKWTGNGGNVQETYTLNYTINGVTYTVTNLSTNFTKNGTGFVSQQQLTYNATFNGQTVVVNYTLPLVMPK